MLTGLSNAGRFKPELTHLEEIYNLYFLLDQYF